MPTYTDEKGNPVDIGDTPKVKYTDEKGNPVDVSSPAPKSKGFLESILGPPDFENNDGYKVPVDRRITDAKSFGREAVNFGKAGITAAATAGASRLAPGSSWLIKALAGLTGGIGANVLQDQAQESFLGAPKTSIGSKLINGAETVGLNEATPFLMPKVLPFGPQQKSIDLKGALTELFTPQKTINDKITADAKTTTEANKHFVTDFNKQAKTTAEQEAISNKAFTDDLNTKRTQEAKDKTISNKNFVDEELARQKLEATKRLGYTPTDTSKIIDAQTGKLRKTQEASVASSNKEFQQVDDAATQTPRMNSETGEVINGPVSPEHNLGPSMDAYLKSEFGDNYLDIPREQVFSLVTTSRRPDVARSAYDLVKKAAVIDEGKIVDWKEIAYKDAHDFKQVAGGIGYRNTNSGGVGTNTERLFRDLSRAADADITSSMPYWKNGTSALEHYKAGNAIITERHQTFDLPSIKAILKAKEPVPANLDRFIRSPEAIGKALGAGVDITPARAYGVQSMIENSIGRNGDIDINTLTNNRNNPEMVASYKKLYGESGLKRIDEFIETMKNIGASPLKAQKPDMVSPISPEPNMIDPVSINPNIPELSKPAQFFRGHLGLSMGSLATIGSVASGMPWSTSARVIIPSYILGRLITSQRTSRALNVLLEGKGSYGVNQLSGKVIGAALNNSRVLVQDGNNTYQAEMKDGNVVPSVEK